MRVYILVDTSASMTGAPQQAAQNAVVVLLRDLPQVFATSMKIYLLGFGSKVRVWVDGSSLASVQISTWKTGGTSRLGLALQQVLAWQSSSASPRGMLFVMSDGFANDSWQEVFEQLEHHYFLTTALLCGQDAQDNLFQNFFDKVLVWHMTSQDTLINRLIHCKTILEGSNDESSTAFSTRLDAGNHE